MKRLLFSIAAVAFMFAACDDPISNSSAPTGLPDWNDPQYDWIAGSCEERCPGYCFRGRQWIPKFTIRVCDASPDGRQILLALHNRLAVYDTTTGAVQTAIPYSCEYGTWSPGGRYIISTVNTDEIAQRLALYDTQIEQHRFLPLPPATTSVDATPQWLPGDTAFIVGLTIDSSFGYYRMNLNDTGTPRRVIATNSEMQMRGTEVIQLDYTGHGPSANTYEVSLARYPYQDTSRIERYHLTGLTMEKGYNLSHDGNWLAASILVDCGGSRLASGNAHLDHIPALAIIDLRQGSTTENQIYRVFPDHSNLERHCSFSLLLAPSAWSGDGRYVYHEMVRDADSTMQIVRREVRTGRTEEISNFLQAP